MSSQRRPPAGAKPASRAPTKQRAPERRRRGRLARAVAGDRPFLLGLLVLVLLLAVMAAGPLERYAAAADRVDALVEERDFLEQEVGALEERARELEDPEEVELLARSELGLVLPGDDAYVIVGPSPSPAPQDHSPDGDVEWYRRLGRALSELVR